MCDNGDVHTGVFKCGSLFDGSFKTLYHGTMYVPQIVIALLSVQISFVYRFVFRFTGNIREGRWDGHGTQKFPNGDVLTGVYTDGELHCQGIRVFPDGQKYMPFFVDQLKNINLLICTEILSKSYFIFGFKVRRSFQKRREAWPRNRDECRRL